MAQMKFKGINVRIFGKSGVFFAKSEKNPIPSLKIRKKFTKDFHVKKNYMGILCKMNTDQNYMEFFCTFFCWRSLINLEGNSFIKHKREIFTKDFLVKKYFHEI